MAKETVKNFPLRLTEKNIYTKLEKEAKLKKWSVNTLINSVILNYFKNNLK